MIHPSTMSIYVGLVCHRAETRMLQTTRNDPISGLSVWAPLVLAVLRIVSALLLIDQGLTTLLHFPQAGVPDALDAGAGVIEVVGRGLIAIGLYTAPAPLGAPSPPPQAYRQSC